MLLVISCLAQVQFQLVTKSLTKIRQQEHTTINAEGADTEGEGYSIAYTAGDISVSYAKINETEQAVSDKLLYKKLK
jgi:hypothetical protein